MPHLYQSTRSDGTPHRYWKFQYTDWTGRRRTATGTTRKRETEKIALRVQDKEDRIRNGHIPPPDTALKHRSTPFCEVKDKYLNWGETHGGIGGRPWGKGHARMRRSHLNWWQERLKLSTVGDLYGTLAEVEVALQELKEKGRSTTTLQRYSGAIRAFCNWAVERKYLTVNPVAGLSQFDTTPNDARRALTLEEIRQLLDNCDPKRLPCYQLALTSGLRANELRKLKVADFDSKKRGLALGDWTKNRKSGFQPLPGPMVAQLRDMTASKKKGNALIYVPSHTARDLNKDFEKAGIPKQTEEGKAIFHSLRYTYATMLDQLGATAKEQEILVRHKSKGITLRLYTKEVPERIGKLVAGIGDYVFPGGKSIKYAVRGEGPSCKSNDGRDVTDERNRVRFPPPPPFPEFPPRTRPVKIRIQTTVNRTVTLIPLQIRIGARTRNYTIRTRLVASRNTIRAQRNHCRKS